MFRIKYCLSTPLHFYTTGSAIARKRRENAMLSEKVKNDRISFERATSLDTQIFEDDEPPANMRHLLENFFSLEDESTEEELHFEEDPYCFNCAFYEQFGRCFQVPIEIYLEKLAKGLVPRLACLAE